MAAVPTAIRHPAVSSVRNVKLTGDFRVDIVPATRPSVAISGAALVVSSLGVTDSHGVLAITTPSWLDASAYRPVRVRIAAPAIDEIDTHGLVRALVSRFSGKRLELETAGGFAATLSGTVGDLTIVSNGVASIDASRLHARDLAVTLRGRADLLAFASHSARIDMYGEGRVEVGGHPPIHSVRTLAYGVVTVN